MRVSVLFVKFRSVRCLGKRPIVVLCCRMCRFVFVVFVFFVCCFFFFCCCYSQSPGDNEKENVGVVHVDERLEEFRLSADEGKKETEEGEEEGEQRPTPCLQRTLR